MNYLSFLDPFNAPVAPAFAVGGSETIIAISPFVFVICIVAIVTLSKYRRNADRQETMRRMIEKGLPIPTDFLAEKEDAPKQKDDRKGGIILIAVGIGLYIFLFSLNNFESDAYGVRYVAVIPTLIGMALLLNWFLSHKDDRNDGSSR
jgi:hypothetical protein